MNKKGSLNLSVNAIVVLILALTMLGIGILFIKTIFGGLIEETAGFTKELSEQQKEEMLGSADEITFKLTDIDMKERKVTIPVAIRNSRTSARAFVIEEGFACTDAVDDRAADAIVANPDLIKFDSFATRTLDGGKSDIIPLTIEIDASAIQTIYSCSFNLKFAEDAEDDVAGSIYSSKQFTINYQE